MKTKKINIEQFTRAKNRIVEKVYKRIMNEAFEIQKYCSVVLNKYNTPFADIKLTSTEKEPILFGSTMGDVFRIIDEERLSFFIDMVDKEVRIF